MFAPASKTWTLLVIGSLAAGCGVKSGGGGGGGAPLPNLATKPSGTDPLPLKLEDLLQDVAPGFTNDGA